ncbi:MAG: aromatic ring-hydroxylating oxygenase subunit alpha [Parahaliea sp.]
MSTEQIKKNIDIDPAIMTRLTEHARNHTTDLAKEDLWVPRSHFVSEQRLRQELAVLNSMPLVVAHRSELPDPGNFVTRTVLGKPLIIVRRSNGSVAAYLNMCSHRGGRVETRESGSRRLFMCQYHGWSYDRDEGELKSVPYGEFFGEIDTKCLGLKAYKAQERHGLIFVDFSNNTGRSLEDYLGPEVDAQMAPWQLDRATIFLEKRFPIRINWKLVLDGAIDILHPQFLHPEGVGKLVSTNLSAWRGYGRHGQHFGVRKKFEKLAIAGEVNAASTKYVASNLVLYPNSMMIAAPEHIEFWTVWPSTESPSHCDISIRFFVNPDILDLEMERRISKSWEILENAAMNEDWPMELWIQENAEINSEGDFLYGRNEQPCQHLYRQLDRDIADLS